MMGVPLGAGKNLRSSAKVAAIMTTKERETQISRSFLFALNVVCSENLSKKLSNENIIICRNNC